jgi:hypothetical protein
MPVTGDEEFTEINAVVDGSEVVVVLEMLASAFEAALEASPVIKSLTEEYFQKYKREQVKLMDKRNSIEITKLSSWELLGSTAKKMIKLQNHKKATDEHWNLLSKLKKKKAVFAPDSTGLDKGAHLGVTAEQIRGIGAHQFEQRLDKLEKVICQNAETHASATVDDVFERMNILERFFEATRAQENAVMEARFEDMSATLKRMELALSRGGHIASHPVSPAVKTPSNTPSNRPSSSGSSVHTHTAIYVSSYCYICVCVSSYCYICSSSELFLLPTSSAGACYFIFIFTMHFHNFAFTMQFERAVSAAYGIVIVPWVSRDVSSSRNGSTSGRTESGRVIF